MAAARRKPWPGRAGLAPPQRSTAPARGSAGCWSCTAIGHRAQRQERQAVSLRHLGHGGAFHIHRDSLEVAPGIGLRLRRQQWLAHRQQRLIQQGLPAQPCTEAGADASWRRWHSARRAGRAPRPGYTAGRRKAASGSSAPATPTMASAATPDSARVAAASPAARGPMPQTSTRTPPSRPARPGPAAACAVSAHALPPPGRPPRRRASCEEAAVQTVRAMSCR